MWTSAVIYLCDYYPGIKRTSSPSPVLSCTVRGLPSHLGHPRRGGLLPHHFTLTSRRRRSVFCGTICPMILANHRPSFSQGTLLCSVRTFLQSPSEEENQRLPGERTARVVVPPKYTSPNVFPQLEERRTLSEKCPWVVWWQQAESLRAQSLSPQIHHSLFIPRHSPSPPAPTSQSDAAQCTCPS